jgi:hypothetical protein
VNIRTTELMKKCTKCKETLDLSEFSRNARAKDGLNSYCKACKRRYDRKNWAKTKIRDARGSTKQRRERARRKEARRLKLMRIRLTYPRVERYCPICQKNHNIDFFHKQSSKADGRQGYCISCQAKRNRRYNREHWAKVKILNARGNTKTLRNRGRLMDDVSITWEWLMDLFQRQPRCYYTGIIMTEPDPDEEVRPLLTEVCLERLDSHRGYTPDNTVLCCYLVNCGKGQATPEETQEFLRLMAENLQYAPVNQETYYWG